VISRIVELLCTIYIVPKQYRNKIERENKVSSVVLSSVL
jgi:hypothetical protein